MLMAQIESQNKAINKHLEERKSFDHQHDSIIDDSFDQQYKKLHEHSKRLDHHHLNTRNHCEVLDLLKGRSEEMRGCHEGLVTCVDDMAGQLCHCTQSVPNSSVVGSKELGYASKDSYHIAPQAPCSQCSSNPSAPEENTSPIPVPAPIVSNDENVDPLGSVRPPAPQLVCRQVLRRLGMPFRCPEACISTHWGQGGIYPVGRRKIEA